MFGAAVFLASGLAQVSMSEDQQRRYFSYYPTWAVLQGRSAGTLLEAVVEPDGKVRECRVVAFVGSERMANEECGRFKQRKMRPATDPDGKPILGVQRNYVSRVLSDHSEETDAVRSWVLPADLTIPAAQPLEGGKARIDARLLLLVKADGSVAACEGAMQWNEREHVPPTLVEAACVEVEKLGQPLRADSAGQPSDYVTAITVRFEASPSV